MVDDNNDELPTSFDRIKRAKVISWICTGLACLSLALSFLLILTLAQVGTRYRVLVQAVPYVPRYSDSFVSVEALNSNVSDVDLITEALIRDFIVNRYSIIPDVDEMVRRFSFGGPIHRYLSPEMYKPYAKQKEVKKYMRDTMEGATPVDVEIRKVSRIGKDWKVEFDTRFSRGRGTVEIKSFVASLTVVFAPSRVSFNPKALNPLGIMITRYETYPVEK